MKNSNKQVVIIDYGLGNLFSVNQACQTVGLNVKISNLKKEIKNADAIILPGVGAFIEAMNGRENVLQNPVSEGEKDVLIAEAIIDYLQQKQLITLPIV